MKVEIGYVGSKVSIKDAFATYTSGKHIIQVGQFYEPFTMDMLCSTFDLRFHQSPGSVLAMTNSRVWELPTLTMPRIIMLAEDCLPTTISVT